MSAAYFAHPAMSQSKLKELKKSPLHFYAKYLSPDAKGDVETEAMRFGSAVHCAILEPELFKLDYIQDLGISKKTNAYKDWKETVTQKIISADDLNIINKMKESFYNKDVVTALLSLDHICEHEIFWIDPKTGIHCKLKADIWIKPCELYPYGAIIDLKTTKNACLEEFSKTLFNLGYYNQSGWYCEGFKQHYKLKDYPAFIFIPIEKEPPCDLSFFVVDDATLEIGLKENVRLLKLYQDCLAKNMWPGYLDEIEPISIPYWAMSKFNFNDEEVI